MATTDDWHEVYTPEPVEEKEDLAAREMEAARKIAAWMDKHAATIREMLPDSRSDNGCCRDCGGWLSCHCCDWDDHSVHTEPDDGYDTETGERRMGKCPCCGFESDPVELFYPYCSNRCFKDRD